MRADRFFAEVRACHSGRSFAEIRAAIRRSWSAALPTLVSQSFAAVIRRPPPSSLGPPLLHGTQPCDVLTATPPPPIVTPALDRPTDPTANSPYSTRDCLIA